MNDGGFGNLVYEYTGNGGAHIALFEGGFRGQSGGHEFVARWEDVAFVRKSHRRLTVAVFDRDFVDLEIGLLHGGVFALAGNDQGAALTAQYVGRLTRPHVGARMMAQLQAPGGVMFAPDVRASAERGLEQLKGGSWRSLPFQNIAGYKVTQGFCLVDENPANPRLFATFYLGKLQNPDAFMDLLDIVAPDRDLFEHPYRSPPGIFTTTAASYDPRYLSNRARALGCLGLLGAGLLAGLIALLVNGYSSQQTQLTSEAFQERTAKYTSALEDRVRDIAKAPPPTTPLREACAGKAPELTSVMLVLASADSDVTGMSKDPLPTYSESNSDGFGLDRQKVDIPQPVQLVIRLLSGTTLNPKGQSVARAFVQVYGEPDKPALCEGLAEGTWTYVTYLEFNEDKTRRLGILTTAVAGLCAKDTKGPICTAASSTSDIKFTEGLPPAPTTTGSKPNGKAPPRK